jgi:hypothetical protein
MRVRQFLSLFCLPAFALACGGNPASQSPPERTGYRLAPAGDADLVLHPGEAHALRVVLAQEDVGTIANGRIHFEFAGDPAGATLDSEDAFTGPDGTAEVSFRAGDRPGVVEISASAPGLDAPDVSFGIEIVPVRKLLRIVAVPGTAIDPDGQTASITVAAPGSVALRVRELDADTGAPIAGDTIVFTLPDGSRASFGRSGEKGATAVTNSSGEAQAFLLVPQTEDPFEAAAYCATGGEPVYFAVTVAEGTLPPEPPPCEPDDPLCAPPCDADCGGGPLPDVTGVWYTKHVFGIRESIPLVVRDVFTSIRFIDQFLSGKLGLPSWLQPVIDTVMRQFLPGWFSTVIRLGDDLVTVLTYLRAEGKMRLSFGGDAAHVKGTEVWTNLVFYWLPLCGEDIDGNPATPPSCARFDVETGDADFPSTPECKGRVVPTITPRVAPFSATVEPVPGSPATFQLTVPPRTVELQMGRAVVTAIDTALSLTTPWSCIEDATDCGDGQQCIVDCAGVGHWVSDFTDGFFTPKVIENACVGAVRLAGQATSDLLASIKFKTDTLVFSGRATIGEVGLDDGACRSGVDCAGQLGNDRFDSDLPHHTESRDGAWTGSFFDDGTAAMPGAWEATRYQFQ